MESILVFLFVCGILSIQQTNIPLSQNFILVDHTNFTKFSINSKTFRDEQVTISLRIQLDMQKTYFLRLDYLPFLAIYSRNDNPITLSDQGLSCLLTIKQIGNLKNREDTLVYQFVLQVRQASEFRVPFIEKKVTVYRYIWKEYLVIIICILGVTFLTEKWLFCFNELASES